MTPGELGPRGIPGAAPILDVAPRRSAIVRWLCRSRRKVAGDRERPQAEGRGSSFRVWLPSHVEHRG